MNYRVWTNRIKIYDSYIVRDQEDMREVLLEIASETGGTEPIWSVPISDMISEWRSHNLLYDIGMFKSHTKDVDITDNGWLMTWVYRIVSLFYIP